MPDPDVEVEIEFEAEAALGGAAAMGTTPDLAIALVLRLAGVLLPWMAGGDSEVVVAVCGRLAVAAATDACCTEFLREDFFEREVPTARVFALLRLRFLITSVLSDNGRTTPCSFRNKPQALQRGWPSGLRRHKGVV